ncbi:MAG: hypothetical protein LM576_02430 [Thermofilum sp.]|nr:hypothetical protein [Thermofilum sp.]
MRLAGFDGEYRVVVAKHAEDEGLQAAVRVEKGFTTPARRKLLSEVQVERANI